MTYFNQEIDLTKVNEKSFFDDIVSANFRLPDMNKLTINNIGIDAHAVNKFFEKWVPKNLKYLDVNKISASKDQVKMEEYRDFLITAINGVSYNVLLCKSIVLIIWNIFL